MTEVLRVENVAKRFGPVIALRDVNLHLEQGEVLGLLGDNGAGKSTLIKILCGYHKPDSGTLYLNGEPVELSSVIQARKLGIDTVYQDLALLEVQVHVTQRGHWTEALGDVLDPQDLGHIALLRLRKRDT